MALFVDFVPLLLFFTAFKCFEVLKCFAALECFAAFRGQPILAATAVAIVATFAQVGWYKLNGQRIKPIHWVNLGIIVVFGGVTLLLHDEFYIKIKMTAYYWLCTLLLMTAKLGWGKNLVKVLLPKEELVLPEAVWTQLLWAWVGFCALMGTLNLYVALNFPVATWVNFKVFGGIGLLAVFVVAQGFLIARHLPKES